MITFISADERSREPRGAKIELIGPPGAGKTWQQHTLNPKESFFGDAEAGDYSIIDVPIDTVRIDDWSMARDLACWIGGPNQSFTPNMAYSEAHYQAIKDKLPELHRYQNFTFDSVTALSRICRRYCEQQPEAISERTGRKDTRAIFGLIANEMLLWAEQLQRARSKNVILVGILERHVDELNVTTWQLQCEGQKTARELPGIVDNVITLQHLDFGDGKPTRAFICSKPNRWNLPAKDRSGRLSEIEEPHLGKLLSKLTTKQGAQND